MLESKWKFIDRVFSSIILDHEVQNIVLSLESGSWEMRVSAAMQTPSSAGGMSLLSIYM